MVSLITSGSRVRPMHDVGESIGWNHGEAQVYKARWNGQPAVLKRFGRIKKYACEVYGYRVWQAQMPRLLHTDLERLELVLEWVEAECALNLEQTEAIYVAAGRALRQMHDAAPLHVPFDDGKLDLERILGSFFPRAEGVLDAWQVERVADMTRDLLDTSWPPTVLRHGDYTARNWLWDGAKLTVIDPEHSRPGPAVLDMAKMHNDGLPPELARAFQQGYGREWSGQEARMLNTGLCIQALTLAVWCHEHADAEGLESMRSALERLLASSPPSPSPQAPR